MHESAEIATGGRSTRRLAVLALGFRPFFLAAGVGAVALMALWIAEYAGGMRVATTYGDVSWHGHEMVFGYTMAVVAGFLLTAVRNWTDLPTVQGGALLALVALWAAGRVAPFAPDTVPPAAVAALDLAFLPALAVAVSLPLLRRRQTRNLVFLLVLLALTGANTLVHIEVLGISDSSARLGMFLGVHLILVLIAIIGGRVFPFFTRRALPGAEPRQWPAIERTSIGAIAALTAALAVSAPPVLIATLAGLGAAANAVRLWGWYDRRIWSTPLLWVLHAGYAWLVVGLAIEGLAALGLLPPLVALHGLTAGAIGVLTLGMMARVALGHTGRPLQASRVVTVAFALVNLAAAARVFGPIAAPDPYVEWIAVAGALWIAAFAIFAVTCVPMLSRPRPDGRPG